MTGVPVYLLPGMIISQPPHLEGDPTLATEILPGPPSLSSVQQSAHRREQRKPPCSVSYLPTSDPGSTYTGLMAGTASAQAQDVDGPRRKRIRIEKIRGTGRPQRASARHMNGGARHSDPIGGTDVEAPSYAPADSDPSPILVDSDRPSVSRSNSGTNLQDGPVGDTNGRTRGAKRDKGKGKEIDPTLMRVKEEPKTISLHTPEPTSCLLNEDHCSACRSQGALVYCDGCPRAFHFWCLDPPMEAIDLPEGDSRWFCPSCVIGKNPPRKPPPSLFSPLIHHVQTNIPVEFQLPDSIRTFFKDVATGPKGAYVDGSEIRQPRLNRHGMVEDRETYRLKDRNGTAVLCFRCGQSALPAGFSPTKRNRNASSKDISDSWKSIVSCDYCNLHWHLDCLDPPLPNLPSFGKKWMCPNHADQLLNPKRRIPRSNPPQIEITKTMQSNNGNIEVIPSQPASTSQARLNVDEVLINGRRYRVPEKVIILDFWSKVNKDPNSDAREPIVLSGMSSPLTSLSSLGDVNESVPVGAKTVVPDTETVTVAELLCNLRDTLNQRNHPSLPPDKIMVNRAVQTDPAAVHRGRVSTSEKDNAIAKALIPKKAAAPNGRASHNDPMPSQSSPSISRTRRRRSHASLRSEATRELRSRNKASESQTSASVCEETSHENGVINGLSQTISTLPPILKLHPSHAKLEAEASHHITHDDNPKFPDATANAPIPKRKIITMPQKRRRRTSQEKAAGLAGPSYRSLEPAISHAEPEASRRVSHENDSQLLDGTIDIPVPRRKRRRTPPKWEAHRSLEPDSSHLKPETSHRVSHEDESQLPDVTIKVSVPKRKIITVAQKRRRTPPKSRPLEETSSSVVKGKKRKEMDESDREEKGRDELKGIDKDTREKVSKAIETMVKNRHILSSSDPTMSNPAKVTHPQTPTLKIRLPRLSSLNSPAGSTTRPTVDNVKRA